MLRKPGRQYWGTMWARSVSCPGTKEFIQMAVFNGERDLGLMRNIKTRVGWNMIWNESIYKLYRMVFNFVGDSLGQIREKSRKWFFYLAIALNWITTRAEAFSEAVWQIPPLWKKLGILLLPLLGQKALSSRNIFGPGRIFERDFAVILSRWICVFSKINLERHFTWDLTRT